MRTKKEYTVRDYTLEDIGAMADARGSSYGVIHSALENGYPLPPLRQSVIWPRGSAHAGEDQIRGSTPVRPARTVPVFAAEEKEPVEREPKACRVRKFLCYACGGLAPVKEMTKVYVHEKDCTHQFGIHCADLCPDCAEQLIPSPPEVPAISRLNARCFGCGTVIRKSESVTINVTTPKSYFPHARCHGCRSCTNEMIREMKKSRA